MTSANLFPGVKVILVETSHPGNIGAAARAMKNMGLTELVLVNPADFPSTKAVFRSASAADVGQEARVVKTVEEALSDCQLIIGTSARERRIPWPLLSAKECGEKVISAVRAEKKVGLLFGRESRGLKNEELQRCQFHVNISTGEAYSSLNLAMAVQVVCYELLQADLAEKGTLASSKAPWDMPLANSGEVEHFYNHLEKTLIQVGFHDPENPRQLMARLRRLFNRVGMDRMEVNILRGFLTAINKLGRVKKSGNHRN